MKKWMVALCGALCLLGSPAMAQEEMEVAMRLGDVDRLSQPLGLTDAQRTKLRDIVIAHTREQLKLKGQLDLQRFELQVLLDQPTADAARTTAQAESVASLRSALELDRVKMMLDVKGVLTPEQQLKMRQQRPPGPPRPGMMMPGRPGGPPPGGPGGFPPGEPPPLTP